MNASCFQLVPAIELQWKRDAVQEQPDGSWSTHPVAPDGESRSIADLDREARTLWPVLVILEEG